MWKGYTYQPRETDSSLDDIKTMVSSEGGVGLGAHIESLIARVRSVLCFDHSAGVDMLWVDSIGQPGGLLADALVALQQLGPPCIVPESTYEILPNEGSMTEPA